MSYPQDQILNVQNSFFYQDYSQNHYQNNDFFIFLDQKNSLYYSSSIYSSQNNQFSYIQQRSTQNPHMKDISEEHHQPQLIVQDAYNCSQDIKKSKQTYLNSKKASQRRHLARQRRKRGQKNQLQRKTNGYWTKNFLQNGKNIHFKYIEKKMGPKFINQTLQIKQIYQKDGINMNDYQRLYNSKELRPIWNQFFRQKILYRQIMVSRVNEINRKIFIKLAYRFQEAYKTEMFDHIA